ncbi:MAG: carboxypeptidase regulatory-like domain-containing protein [Gemmatimonadetes bacterium]|nr:carboxypeptidase regulatory-like domain-containing protein [Gemmatimonadota bacterium]
MDGGHRRMWPAAVRLTLLLTLTSAGPAWAQTVQGTVLDAESGAPIHTADVVLLAADDRIVGGDITDEEGRFVLRGPGAGSYRLRATRLGFESFTTEAFALEPGQNVLAELRLQLDPIPLDSLVAIVEGQKPRRLVRVGFYKRQAMGFGNFLSPDDIEDIRPVFTTDLFWGMRGVRVRRGRLDSFNVVPTRGFCGGLSVSIDGMVVQRGGPGARPADWQSLLHVNDIEAIEVYPSAAGVPAWAAGTVSPCGAILIWTKGSL